MRRPERGAARRAGFEPRRSATSGSVLAGVPRRTGRTDRGALSGNQRKSDRHLLELGAIPRGRLPRRGEPPELLDRRRTTRERDGPRRLRPGRGSDTSRLSGPHPCEREPGGAPRHSASRRRTGVRPAYPGCVRSGLERARGVERTFRTHRALLARRLDALASEPSFISRPDDYRHIRRLIREGRSAAVLADLRGGRALRAIASAARQRAIVFRVVYLSNAEEYLDYGPAFTRNLRALPRDSTTLVLRTLRDRRLPRAPDDRMWHYNAQPLDDLLERIADGYRDSSWIANDLRLTRSAARPEGTSVLDSRTPRHRRGGRRWWLTPPPDVRSIARPRRPSRVLLAVRRAMHRHLDRGARRRLAAVDLSRTGLARVRNAVLPPDPETGLRLVLSGEVMPDAEVRVPFPERNLEAMLFDGYARRVLPALFESESEPAIAHALRESPAANDLYASYRLRDRLLELCPTLHPRPPSSSHRACRALVAMIRQAPTERARPDAHERRRAQVRTTRILAGLCREHPTARAELVETVERLAAYSRSFAPAPRPQ